MKDNGGYISRCSVPAQPGEGHFVRLIFLAFALLLVSAPSAQELTLRSFHLLENDLTARSYQRKDLNGDLCALIKVQLPIAGCVFEGSKIGDVEFKVNEYWLYVTPGTKRIYIKCPGLESSMIIWEKGIGSQYGVTSGSTYMMRLDGYPSALASAAQTPVRDGNYIVFNLTPADATVRIDGQQQAPPKNGKLSLYLSSGTHSYDVSAYGYASSSGVVSMGTERQSLDVTLTSVMAVLTLSCATQGASFYVNDERVGEGGWSGSLVAGNYRVEARKEGYRSQFRDVTLAENARETVSFPSLAAVLGSLDVNYDPVDAEVWLDGSRLGVSPNVWDVTVGSHTVEVRSSGYESEKRSVSIVEGQTLRLAGSLKSGNSSVAGVVSSSSSTSSDGMINGHEYVDLGLSVKWATCNVGASSPIGYGDYFAWGETSTKSKYLSRNSKTSGNDMGDISGNYSYDAARAIWGGSWRLPTQAEFQELIDNCESVWTTQNGVEGRKFTSIKNGKSVFLPAAGWHYSSSLNNVGSTGNYWGSTPDSSGSYNAYSLSFGSGYHDVYSSNRGGGRPVRPVSE